jgi:hypothetical protein
MPPLSTQTGWQSAGRPWTHIIGVALGRPVPGTHRSYTDLLFYDSAGTGAFYATHVQGEIEPLSTHTGWQSAGRPWTHIIAAGRLLLFYDSAGTGAFYTTDTQGGITHSRTHTGWVSPAGNPWTHITYFPDVGVRVGDSNSYNIVPHLMFFDSGAGTAAFYTVDNLTHRSTHTGLVSPAGNPWTQIVPFSEAPHYFLFYDGAGTVAFYRLDGDGGITPVRTHSNLPSGRIIAQLGWANPG